MKNNIFLISCLYSFNLISSDSDKNNLASAAAAMATSSSYATATSGTVSKIYWQIILKNGLIIKSSCLPDNLGNNVRIHGADYKRTDIASISKRTETFFVSSSIDLN